MMLGPTALLRFLCSLHSPQKRKNTFIHHKKEKTSKDQHLGPGLERGAQSHHPISTYMSQEGTTGLVSVREML